MDIDYEIKKIPLFSPWKCIALRIFFRLCSLKLSARVSENWLPFKYMPEYFSTPHHFSQTLT